MVRGREEQTDARDTFSRGGDATHYQLLQKMWSIGDDYWIENEAGERVFKVDGKVLHLRRTLFIEDTQGNELLKIQERLMHIKDTMEIERPDGTSVATVKKAFFSPFHERWTIHVADGHDLEVHGNLVDHEYTVRDGDHQIAEVSKKWFRIRDTYGVEVEPGQPDVLILAAVVVLDEMAHPTR